MNAETGSSAHLDIGGVFEATTDLWKKTFGTVWIVALILMVPAGIISGLLGGRGLVLQLVGNVVIMIAAYWLIGAVVKIVEAAETGGRVDIPVGDLLGSVSSKIVPLFLLAVVVGVLTWIGFLLLIVPGVILTLMWIVSAPALVVEDKGVLDSMSRSADLTRDNRMRILGVGILILAIFLVIGILIGILGAITPVLGIIGGIVLMVIAYPWLSIVEAVLYFRLRELKGEGIVTPEPVGAGAGASTSAAGPEDGVGPTPPGV